mgnify:CR=1 FL=1
MQKYNSLDEACQKLAPMVHKHANKWVRNHRQDYDDLVQAGYLGICIAWEKFDETKGASFSTYAWLWIRERIKATAEGNWKVFNNMHYKPIEDQTDLEGYSIDERAIDKARLLDKIETKAKKIFQLREEGETFQTISDQLGLKSLHEARGIYMDTLDKIKVEG